MPGSAKRLVCIIKLRIYTQDSNPENLVLILPPGGTSSFQLLLWEYKILTLFFSPLPGIWVSFLHLPIHR